VVKVESNTEASMELQLIKMERKVAAGARFFQTQAVYDADHFADYNPCACGDFYADTRGV
jgi:5,10-methylenetetrahydrofolate reductase